MAAMIGETGVRGKVHSETVRLGTGERLPLRVHVLISSTFLLVTSCCPWCRGLGWFLGLLDLFENKNNLAEPGGGSLNQSGPASHRQSPPVLHLQSAIEVRGSRFEVRGMESVRHARFAQHAICKCMAEVCNYTRNGDKGPTDGGLSVCRPVLFYRPQGALDCDCERGPDMDVSGLVQYRSLHRGSKSPLLDVRSRRYLDEAVRTVLAATRPRWRSTVIIRRSKGCGFVILTIHASYASWSLRAQGVAHPTRPNTPSQHPGAAYIDVGSCFLPGAAPASDVAILDPEENPPK